MLKLNKHTQINKNHDEVLFYTLSNGFLEITVMDFGATVTSIKMPDRNGKIEEIVLGFSAADSYINLNSYFGATVGRVAGRITNGNLNISKKTYELTTNEGVNQLHGGGIFNQRIWQSETFQFANEIGVKFNLRSPSGEGGYPGNLLATVIMSLDIKNNFSIKYEALTDETTVYNPTNHTYFNLSGNLSRTIRDHYLKISSDEIVSLANDLIPTGELLNITGTAFDFNEFRQIEEGIQSQHPQNQLVGGYDHAFVFKNRELLNDISLWDKTSGRLVTATTDMPSVVVYSGNQLLGEYIVSEQKTEAYSGITLETQFLPDTPTFSHFGTIELGTDELFESKTTFNFSIK